MCVCAVWGVLGLGWWSVSLAIPSRLQAGGKAGERPLEEGVRLPHLRAWFRTRSAIVLHLSNGTIQVCDTTCAVAQQCVRYTLGVPVCLCPQINFFQDHTKVIICPLMQAVSYIDEGRGFCTFKIATIEQVRSVHPLDMWLLC